MIVWRARGKSMRSVLCSIVCNNCTQWTAHSHMNRPNSSLDWVLSHWALFTVRRFICVYVLFCVWLDVVCMCSIVTWWGGPGGIEAWSLGPLLRSVLWHCWFGHLTRKKPVPDMTCNVLSGTLNPTQSDSSVNVQKQQLLTVWEFQQYFTLVCALVWTCATLLLLKGEIIGCELSRRMSGSKSMIQAQRLPFWKQMYQISLNPAHGCRTALSLIQTTTQLGQPYSNWCDDRKLKISSTWKKYYTSAETQSAKTWLTHNRLTVKMYYSGYFGTR